MAKVLIVGSGGREAAVGARLCEEGHAVLYAPGNGGTPLHNVPIAVKVAEDVDRLVAFAKENLPDLVFVGPELPLTLGAADALSAVGMRVVGPTKAACIESSKERIHRLCERAGIPRPKTEIFELIKDGNADACELMSYIKEERGILCLKADGLAAGKGAFPCRSVEEAEQAVQSLLALGAPAQTVLAEEMLEGEEVSAHAYGPVMTPLVRDYKLFNGANTGGMGAWGPVDFPQSELDYIGSQFVQPMLAELENEGNPYRGILYPGLMKTASGYKLLEYNSRGGDPETQVLMMLLKSDLYPALISMANGSLKPEQLLWKGGCVVNLVLASAGYPKAMPKDLQNSPPRIYGLKEAAKLKDVQIVHAGTWFSDGDHFAVGGRVLNVLAWGETKGVARTRAYEAAAHIRFEGKQMHEGVAM